MKCPMRVMIDARMLIGRFSGVARVVTQLVDKLANQGEIEVVALCGREAYAPWVGRTDVEVMTSSFDRGDRTACRRALWEATVLPRIIRRARVDVFHATWNSGVPALCSVPSVLTIHDLIPWKDPRAHFTTARQRLFYQYAVRASARRASCVTTVSEHVRRQVIDTLHLRPERVVSIPNGVSIPSDKTTTLDPSTPPYALYVGGYESRKNVAAVFAAVQHYRQRYDPVLELHLTGNVGSLSGEAKEAYRSLSGDARIRFLGDVDDDELERQYASAGVLLMLSRDEGFGLPVLEAMAHGCPVIAAANAALPEVVGDAGVLVDPDNAEEVSNAMGVLVADPYRRAEYVRRGRQRASEFGWEVAASRMHALYECVLRGAVVPRRSRNEAGRQRFPLLRGESRLKARADVPAPARDQLPDTCQEKTQPAPMYPVKTCVTHEG